MFLTLNELLRWLGLTAFEIFVALVCFLIFTVLLTLKVEGLIDSTSWWTVNAPSRPSRDASNLSWSRLLSSSKCFCS